MPRMNASFKPGYGGLKYGNSFWNGARPAPDAIIARLVDGMSVALFGLGQIGKSSLLAETRERLQSDKRNVIWVSLGSENSLTKTLSMILYSMQQVKENEIVSSLKKWAESTEVFPSEIRPVVSAVIQGRVVCNSDDFDENYTMMIFRELGQLLKTRKPENRPIIILDDLTHMLSNAIDSANESETKEVVSRLNSFLAMLRNWRSDDVGITMAISGSIPMNLLQRKHGIKSEFINDCVPIRIQEMERQKARELIDACVRARPPKFWNDDCTEELLKILPAYYPGVVQLAFSVIYTEEISLELLKGPLRAAVFDALRVEYFNQFGRQFSEYIELEQVRASKLFDAIEKKKGGTIESTEAIKILKKTKTEELGVNVMELLDNLTSDYFVQQEFGGVKFTSSLVPVWHKKQLLQT